MKRIGVLMGGITKEREISLRTGQAVSAALKRKGYDVVDIDVGPDIFEKLKAKLIDAAFIALHGKFGEDGCIQGMLEMMRIPYTGGGVLASSVGMDKAVCSTLAMQIGILVPREESLNLKEETIDDFRCSIKCPLIVKPSREGSTINMTIVRQIDKLKEAIGLAAKSDEKIIVQEYIHGKEVTVGMLNGRSLPPLEIVPKSGFYDYASKYTKGMTEYIVPARISQKSAEKIAKWSEDIYKTIDCSGTARCDFIISENDRPYFLEINTIPGMTELSLVPKAALHIGITFDDLVEEILGAASLKVNI